MPAGRLCVCGPCTCLHFSRGGTELKILMSHPSFHLSPAAARHISQSAGNGGQRQKPDLGLASSAPLVPIRLCSQRCEGLPLHVLMPQTISIVSLPHPHFTLRRCTLPLNNRWHLLTTPEAMPSALRARTFCRETATSHLLPPPAPRFRSLWARQRRP